MTRFLLLMLSVELCTGVGNGRADDRAEVFIQSDSNSPAIGASSWNGMGPEAPQTILHGVFVDPAHVKNLAPLRVPKGPEELPDRLWGVWKISVCATRHHTWIRFENVETHETHTLGRYAKGTKGLRDERTGQQLVPDADRSGVYWDMDLMFEDEIRAGRFILLSVIVQNPVIHRGANNGFGYTLCTRNCTSFARSAWQFYSGEDYPQPWLDMPEDFAYFIWKRHPQVPFAKLLGYRD